MLAHDVGQIQELKIGLPAATRWRRPRRWDPRWRPVVRHRVAHAERRRSSTVMVLSCMALMMKTGGMHHGGQAGTEDGPWG